MDKNNWLPCIVTAFDLVGMQRCALTGKASSLMVKMHQFAVEKINSGLPNHSHGYVWNDSVLLLSYVTQRSKKLVLLNELSDFKQALEKHCGVKVYAISVQGLGFPQNDNIIEQQRAVILKTSSWAMANCFLVEKQLKKHRADWYIDSRITKGLALPKPFDSVALSLLPKNQTRTINMYKGYFHAQG